MLVTAAGGIEEDSDRCCGSDPPCNKELAGAETGGTKHAITVVAFGPQQRPDAEDLSFWVRR